ncbi:MAG: protein kinase, partial [Myxococcales bacterium]|nr:protein kinase [Myxococcales bacterium]
MSVQFGRFELLERIGVGGMAEVWKARVAGIGGFEKIVVVKKILPAFAQNKTFIEMLLAEARLCAVLHHTNIVQTYENGEIEGQYYIAMEWVQGHDLFKILSRATGVGQRLPVEVC